MHESAIKNGKSVDGNQRWKCKKCKRNFVITDEEDLARIVKRREPILRRRIRNKILRDRQDLLDKRIELRFKRNGDSKK
jgi:transposase-like protein